jgi:3',5'-cyclic AMP phosphodiesterase CpdA
MRLVRWLHISDIHMRPRDAWQQDIVLNALVEDVKRQRLEGEFDFILASGDLAFSGKTKEYGMAAGFMPGLGAAAGVPNARIFCIPGNHDIDRSRHKLTFLGAAFTFRTRT